MKVRMDGWGYINRLIEELMFTFLSKLIIYHIRHIAIADINIPSVFLFLFFFFIYLKDDEYSYVCEELESCRTKERYSRTLLAKLQLELQESRLNVALNDRVFKQLYEALIKDFESSTEASEMALEKERIKTVSTLKLVKDASELQLKNLRLEFELAATASSSASEKLIMAYKNQVQMASNKLNEEREAKAFENFNYEINSDYENELKKAELEVATSDASLEYKNNQAIILADLKLEYELAAKAATNAAEINIQSLQFKHQLASHFLMRRNDSVMASCDTARKEAVETARKAVQERAESQLAIKASEEMLLNQQFKFEIAAEVAAENFKFSMDTLQENSKSIIDKFNVEIVEKDLKYLLTKMTAERLEQQILTDRLEQEAAIKQKETDLMLSICGNVTHDLKSPLHTLIMGIENLRSIGALTGRLLYVNLLRYLLWYFCILVI